jgi:hypothetical protein
VKHIALQWVVAGAIGGFLGAACGMFIWGQIDKTIDLIFRGRCTKCGKKL